MRRRRRLAVGLALALLALAALVAGVAAWTLAGGAPEELRRRAELRLSEALGTEVRLERAGLSLRWGLLLEAREVRAWPRGGEPALRVGHLYARPDWWGLLLGRFRLGWLRLEEARLRLARGPGGLALGSEPPAAEAEGADAAGAGGASALVAAVEEALHAALGGGLPVRALRMEGARIELRESGRDGLRTLVLADAEGRARQDRLGGGSLRLEGRLFEAAGAAGAPEAGRVAIRAERGEEREVGFELDAVPLGLTAPWAAELGLPPGLAGRASGELTWRWAPRGPHGFEGAFVLGDLRLPLARDREPLRLDEAALEASLAVSPRHLRLGSARLETGALALRAEGTLGLPLGSAAPLRLALATGALPLDRAASLAESLPAPAGPVLAGPLARLEGGRLASLEAELDTSWEGARELLASRGLAPAGALAFRARVEDAALRIGGDERLEALTGELRLEEGTLRIEARAARLNGERLPALGARFRGLAALGSLEAFRCASPAPVPPLPGWRVVQEVLAGEPGDGRGDGGWSRIALRAEHVAHPALLCRLEDAAAELTPARGEAEGFSLELDRGRWAGIPIRARGRYAARPERAELEVELGAPAPGGAAAEAGGAARGPERVWARGGFEAEIERAGPGSARRVEGRFRAAGSGLRLHDAALHLDPPEPGSAVRGELALELAHAAEAPYAARVELADAGLAELLRARGVPEPPLTGRLSGAGHVRGRLRPGRSPLLGARGTFSLHAREGTLRRELPLLIAIVLASEGWNPFREEDRIPYRALDVVARLQGGYALVDALALDAPRLRAAGSGRVALESPHALEGVLGLYFFRTLDTLLGRIPVLNRALLGGDENLLGAYFALSGPWHQPRARLVPVKTVASGPASILLEGVPELFAGSVRRVQSILVPGAGGGEARAPEPEREEP